ncbi:hypothetical protein [Nonlabens sp. Asnod3-A02]|uniref:hypothetical protein n=1 Tax=Nonlabens sp. Asnod3-A02 TaxID=3160579 RepID=UPI003869A8BF
MSYKALIFMLFSVLGYSQINQMVEIQHISYSSEHVIDTLISRSWEKTDFLSKKRIIKRLKEINRNKENDSLKTTHVLLDTDKSMSIKIGTNVDSLFYIDLKNPSTNYSYRHSQFAGCLMGYRDRQTYETITLPKNGEVYEVIIHLLDDERFAKVKIDTHFSEVYINVHLKYDYTDHTKTEIETVDSLVSNSNLKNKLPLPPLPEVIEVIEDIDRITVFNRY